MINNCLVTKLKGAVQNENLPIYNVAFFSITDRTQIISAYFATGNNGSVKITSKVPFLPFGTQTKVTERTISANSLLFFTIAVSDFTSDEEMKDLITIENYYNCTIATLYAGIFYKSLLAELDQYQNVESLLKVCPIELACVPKNNHSIDINDAAYYLMFNNPDDGYLHPGDYDKYMKRPNIEVITGASADGAMYVDGTEDYSDSELLYLGGCFSGDTTHLPYNLRFLYVASLKGSIENFVTMARGKGRTTGALVLGGIVFGDGVTYEGKTIHTHYDEGVLPLVEGGAGYCFVWDAAGNITLSDTMPSGYEVFVVPGATTLRLSYPSDYYVHKHQ